MSETKNIQMNPESADTISWALKDLVRSERYRVRELNTSIAKLEVDLTSLRDERTERIRRISHFRDFLGEADDGS